MIGRRATLGLLLVAVVGCGGGNLTSTGAAGSAGGAVGAGGAGGDALPACGDPPDPAYVVELAVLGPNGTPVTSPVAAAVTVTSVERCTVPTCGSSALLPMSRIVLSSAAQEQWAIHLANAAMPSDLIEAGDAFDLAIDVREDQTLYRTIDLTVTLTREGNLMVFAASLSRFHRLALPDLSAFGIVMADQGAVCESAATFGCLPRAHSIRLTIGTEGAFIGANQAVRAGGFSITNGGFTELADSGTCDTKSVTKVAGFRLP